MKLKLLLLCILVNAGTSIAQTFTVSAIVSNGPDTNRINLVFLSDGFQSGQLTTFKAKVGDIQDYVFNQTPFKQYERFFNVYTIEVPSVDSGVKHPGTATDVTEPAFPVASPNTYFGSAFDNGNIHRAVEALNSSAVYNVLNNNFPMYDVPMVLVNTPQYGGTGGNYLTFTVNTSANETAVHELGHTFGKVWDEYWNGMPGEHPNMTQENDPALVKWKNWMGFNNIGIYAHGTSYPESSWYRPHQNCKMRYLGSPLCAVCRENIIDRVYEKVKPIDAISPDTVSKIQSSSTAAMNFAFTPIRPNPSTLKFTWTLNGNVINTADTAIQLSQSQLNIGDNQLLAVITDTTVMSRSYLPAKGYMFSIQWTLRRDWPAGITDINTNNKFVYGFYPVPATNTLNLQCENNTKATTLSYEITTITGSVAKKGTLPLAQGEQTIPMDIAGLAAGNYTCTLHGDGIYVTAQIVIE